MSARSLWSLAFVCWISCTVFSSAWAEQDHPEVHSVDSLENAPPKNCSAPVMPADAKQRGISGSVTVRISIDESGNVLDIQVLASDPPGVFDNVVIDALRACRFKPEERNGRPVPATAKRIYHFGQRSKPN